MKQSMASSVPPDPHQWEEQQAHLVWFPGRDWRWQELRQYKIFICRRCKAWTFGNPVHIHPLNRTPCEPPPAPEEAAKP